MINSLAYRDTSREKLLKKQFYRYYKHLTLEMTKSLDRIYNYICYHTSISYIEFIDAKILEDYIKYHISKGFCDVSFEQVIKDVKRLKIFLCIFYKHHINFDVSCNNFHLWLKR